MFRQFIHIGFDSIFIDYTIQQFEAIIPLRSDYIIDIPNVNYETKHIRNTNKITKLVLNEKDIRNTLIENLKRANIVFLHCLNQNMIDIVNKVDNDITFVWIVWGGEVNELPLLRRYLYQPQTQQILRKSNKSNFRGRLYTRFPELHYLLYELKTKKKHPEKEKISAIHRINFSGDFIKPDFDFFNSIYDFKLKWLWYAYYSINDNQPDKLDFIDLKKNNIFVGNSADPRNNHLDIFKLLKSLELKGKKIFCPLSYGTNDISYANEVKTLGHSIFGNQFSPLIDFLPMKEYNAILKKCAVIIMNHNTQQAVNNIMSSVWNGSKIYLNNCNPIYKYLKDLNIIIYSIQHDLRIENPFALQPLSNNQIIHNRKIIYDELSQKSVYKKTETMINLLLNEKKIG